MAEESKERHYGLVIFPPGTPAHVRIRKGLFFLIFCVIVLLQAFYWLFANSAEPIVLGLPWGMFIVTLLIALEFIVLLLMYFVEVKEMEDE